ncbi:dephospho-CoA kinase [Acidomonas methanolica]|uniref:Dephospho-CoA kinase n=2 Tax=Acidomonas methanolica TaxID=437 RepID=A0A023D4J0_ACIMT|nr:dephospho-CoA kinase [Acidomonas methanolica]MBU2653241.1 dephospho-CoA kinase [Acidomonas methanolica]GAJ28994.1 dephospho-CoA kinase [Acidomonas methanolica NBRC 104435]GEK97624.1 dephospho-CoA kinase [Acidomonas methanolica NBRC 104435]
MRILGLTGGMGAGKTYVATLFRATGWPVFDADACVHRLQSRGGAAIAPIARLWPGVVVDGAVNRAKLRAAVIHDPEAMRTLEGVIHPLVRQEREHFVRHARARGHRWCVFEIPLLFETGAERECDRVLVVTAPESLRIRRVMRRRSVDLGQARALLARQMAENERRRRADFVLHTGLSRAETFRQFIRIKTALESLP